MDYHILLAQLRMVLHILLYLPYYFATSIFPSTRSSPTLSFRRSFLLHIMRVVSAAGARYGFGDGFGGDHRELKTGKGLLGVYVEPIQVHGELARWAENADVQSLRTPGYWIRRDGSNLAMEDKPLPGEKVLYYMHGGAFVSFSAHPSAMPANIPKALLSTGDPRFQRCFSIEYRLCKADRAPEKAENPGPFPAALIDALAGYNYLVTKADFQPQDVVMVGDSAGGAIALAVCRYLITVREEGQRDGELAGLPPPGAMVLGSPWADLSDSHSFSGSYVENAGCDYLTYCFEHVDRHHSHAPRNLVSEKQLQEEPDFYCNPYLSPACRRPGYDTVDFSAFPRTFISAGGLEMFRDQIRELRKRMARDIGEDLVEYLEAPNGVHDYFVLDWYEPEKSEFFRRAGAWMSKLP